MSNHWQDEFLKTFRTLCDRYSAWQLWDDFITVTAIALSNSTETNFDRMRQREKEYAQICKHYDDWHSESSITVFFVKLFQCAIASLEENPEQDFLGTLFMELGLNNHWKGQFFTPYNVCRLMSAATIGKEELEQGIVKHGLVTINDCACGAGATLIAAANRLKEIGINYQKKALFIGQDVDRVTGLMCYIQLSLLGCPGVVKIGDTLTDPWNETDFENAHTFSNIWVTPMYQMIGGGS